MSSSPLLADTLDVLRPRAPQQVPKGRRAYAGVAILAAFVLILLTAHTQRPSAEQASEPPIHGFSTHTTDFTCAASAQNVTACPLSEADLKKAPNELFRLQPIGDAVAGGKPLLLEIVSTAEQSGECLLRSSVFSVALSGPRIERAQLVHGSSTSLLYAVDIDEPGEYRVEAYLRLFNYPLAVCDTYALRAEGRYVDQTVVDGNATVIAEPSWWPSALSHPRRTCQYGDMYDMRGAWLEPPTPGTVNGMYEMDRCVLAESPTPAQAFEHAKQAGIRWLRFLGDSNTRYLYESFPLVDPAGTALQNFRNDPPYDLRATCGGLTEAPGPQQRNARPTQHFCRVGAIDGDPQDDIMVTWEWFTPIHEPALEAYFDDVANDYWVNATLVGLFTPPEGHPREASADIASILSDRPDLTQLRGGDRVFLSYGSHAAVHTRDDVTMYVDEVETTLERLAILEAADTNSPQRRLSFALSTPKTCRKFADSTIAPNLFKLCHSENFRDKNLAILRGFAARRLTGSNGETVPPPSADSAGWSPAPRAPLDVMDFWHTTEAIENHMTDKVHFGPGVYFLHSRAFATSAFWGLV